MEMIRLNIEYDLLLQKTKLSSNTIERENNTVVRSTDHIYFVFAIHVIGVLTVNYRNLT